MQPEVNKRIHVTSSTTLLPPNQIWTTQLSSSSYKFPIANLDLIKITKTKDFQSLPKFKNHSLITLRRRLLFFHFPHIHFRYLLFIHTWQWCASRSYPTHNPLLKMRTLLTLRPPPPPSVLLPCLSSLPPHPSFLFSFRPNKRFHFLSPCSSLKQSKKKSLQKTTRPPNAPPPQSQRWFFNNPKGDEGGEIEKTDETDGALGGDTALKGTILAGVFLVGIVGGFACVGYLYKDQINAFLNQFSTFIEGKFAKFLYPFQFFLISILLGIC